MSRAFIKEDVESFCLNVLTELGYTTVYGLAFLREELLKNASAGRLFSLAGLRMP